MTERRVAVVTGATSGIGRPIARGLAAAGLHVVLVARDAARARETAEWIAAAVPGASTTVVLADLSMLAQTRAAAGRIGAAHPRIAVLVNNAGMYSPRAVVTAEGHALTLAVNHLSPFLLTRLLEPNLRAAGAARVVNVGSAAADGARLEVARMDRPQGGYRAYRESKLALLMAGMAWAARLAPEVTVNTVHPGVVATKIVSVAGLAGVVWRLAMPFMISPERGAETPLHVALAPDMAGVTGRYFKRCAEAAPNPRALDAAACALVWAETARLVG